MATRRKPVEETPVLTEAQAIEQLEPSLDDIEREALAIDVAPPRKQPVPLWAWGLMAFGAYKMLGKRR